MKRLLIGGAVLLSVSLLLFQVLSQKNSPQIPEQTQHLEWFGKNVTITQMNEQGQLKEIIFAKTLAHYMPDNMTDLSKVNLQIFPSLTQPDEWHLHSDKGRLFHGEKRQDIIRIDLWHNVHLERPASLTQSAVTIDTSTIAIFPEEEYAQTDQYTIVNQTGHQMSGNGMKVFFPTQEFYLIDNVSSTHESEN